MRSLSGERHMLINFQLMGQSLKTDYLLLLPSDDEEVDIIAAAHHCRNRPQKQLQSLIGLKGSSVKDYPFILQLQALHEPPELRFIPLMLVKLQRRIFDDVNLFVGVYFFDHLFQIRADSDYHMRPFNNASLHQRDQFNYASRTGEVEVDHLLSQVGVHVVKVGYFEESGKDYPHKSRFLMSVDEVIMISPKKKKGLEEEKKVKGQLCPRWTNLDPLYSRWPERAEDAEVRYLHILSERIGCQVDMITQF